MSAAGWSALHTTANPKGANPAPQPCLAAPEMWCPSEWMRTVLQTRLSPVPPLKGSYTPSNRRSGLCPACVCPHSPVKALSTDAEAPCHTGELTAARAPPNCITMAISALASSFWVTQHTALFMSLILTPSSQWCSQPPQSHWAVAAVTSSIFSRSIHSCFCYTGLLRSSGSCAGAAGAPQWLHLITCTEQWDCGARTRGQARVVLMVESLVLRG